MSILIMRVLLVYVQHVFNQIYSTFNENLKKYKAATKVRFILKHSHIRLLFKCTWMRLK